MRWLTIFLLLGIGTALSLARQLPSEDVPLVEFVSPGQNFNTFDLSPDSSLLMGYSPIESDLRLWDVTTGEELDSLAFADEHFTSAFSPDSRLILTSQSAASYHRLTLHDARTREQRLALDITPDLLCPASVTACPDGRFIYSGSTWVAPALSADGRLLAAAGNLALDLALRHAAVLLYNVETKTAVVLDANNERAFDVRFNPDGSLLIGFTSSGDSCSRLGALLTHVWDVPTQTLLFTRDLSGLSDYAFSPDGKTLALARNLGECLRGTSMLALWDLSADELTVLSDEGAIAVAYSPDGTRLAVLGGGVLRLWDVSARTPLRQWTLTSDQEGFWGYATNRQIRFLDSEILVAARRHSIYMARLPLE